MPAARSGVQRKVPPASLYTDCPAYGLTPLDARHVPVWLVFVSRLSTITSLTGGGGVPPVTVMLREALAL